MQMGWQESNRHAQPGNELHRMNLFYHPMVILGFWSRGPNRTCSFQKKCLSSFTAWMRSKTDVCKAIKGKQLASLDGFYQSLVMKCQLLSNVNFRRAIYGIFIVCNEVFAIHKVFQVAHRATTTFKVSGNILEINICDFFRYIGRFLTKIYHIIWI